MSDPIKFITTNQEDGCSTEHWLGEYSNLKSYVTRPPFDYPSYIEYYSDGKTKCLGWRLNDRWYRENQQFPARVYYYRNGGVKSQEWFGSENKLLKKITYDEMEKVLSVSSDEPIPTDKSYQKNLRLIAPAGLTIFQRTVYHNTLDLDPYKFPDIESEMFLTKVKELEEFISSKRLLTA